MSFIFLIGLISLVTGAIFLWLSHVVKDRQYFIFSLICFSAALYTMVKFVAFLSNPLFYYTYRNISMSGAIMMAPFVIHFATLISRKRTRLFLVVVYFASITATLMCLFHFHFFSSHEFSTYHFFLTNMDVVVHAPDIGYNIFMALVMTALIYGMRIFSIAHRRKAEFILPTLAGLELLAVCSFYDTLWVRRIISKPFYPLAEFGFLALVAGMGITLIRRLLHNTSQLAALSTSLRKMERERSWLSANLRKHLQAEHARAVSLPCKNDDGFLERVEKIARENLQDPTFFAKQFAHKLNMTPTHLNRKLKTLTGKTSTQFILTMRLERAALLLRKSSATLSEIAGHIGLPDPAYFTRCFKKYFSMTPGQYRDSHSTSDKSVISAIKS